MAYSGKGKVRIPGVKKKLFQNFKMGTSKLMKMVGKDWLIT